MIRRLAFLFLISCGPTQAANLSGYWFGSGGYKLAQEDKYPVTPCAGPGNGNCGNQSVQISSLTLTRNWDGTTARMFGAGNETIGGVLYLLGGSVDASSVTVTISSFTGTGTAVGSGIASVAVSSANAWNTSTRPIQEFYVRYLPIHGRSVWYQEEYEARHDPPRFRRPCTTNANNDCTPNNGTLWTQRPDHDKHYPEIMVPYEFVQNSSFTVTASSSQAIWFDVYASSSLPSGIYTATITVSENVTVSTTIPVQFELYNFVLPDTPTFNAAIYISLTNVNDRQYGGISWNDSQPYLTTYDHYIQMLHAHGYYSVLGDERNGSGKNYPTDEWTDYLSGAAFTPARGYGNARGVGTGAPVYTIGTYGGWPNGGFVSTSTTGGSTGFCTYISSWSAYFQNNYPNVRSPLYIEDEPSNFATGNTWSTWLSTSCAVTHPIPGWITGSYTNLNSSTPYVNNPVTTNYYGTNIAGSDGSKSRWATLASSYSSTSGSQAWYYNGAIQGTGMMPEPEDDGISPEVTFWAMYKKGVQGYFQWESTNYSGQGGTVSGRADLFNDAKTFGQRNWFVNFTLSGITTNPTCDYTDTNGNEYQNHTNAFAGTTPNSGIWSTINIAINAGYGSAPPSPPGPTGTLSIVSGTCGGQACSCGGDATLSYSTGIVSLADPINGYNGFDYANGDGVFLYPGTDVTYANPNYGFNGPFAGWKLKMHRRAINDMEYLYQAHNRSSSATKSIVNNTVPNVLWDLTCFDSSDCSFLYGERGWTNDPNSWELARESLAQIIVGTESQTVNGLGGKTKLSGSSPLIQ